MSPFVIRAKKSRLTVNLLHGVRTAGLARTLVKIRRLDGLAMGA